MKTRSALTSMTALCILTFGFDLNAQTGSQAKIIKEGSQVSLEYTLGDSDGKMIESNVGKEPLRYTHGQGKLVPGLEKQLEDMKNGEQKKIVLKPEEAYGPVDPKAFREFPKDKIPPDALKVGAQLEAKSPAGQSFTARVHEIKENTVVIDFNPPLAGKTLVFDVTILTVEEPQAK